MTRLRWLFVPVLCALGACGGGGSSPTSSGGGSTPPATPTPIVTAVPTAMSSATAYSVMSVPAGLAVTVTNDGSSRSSTTPTTVKPAQSNFQTTISITPSNGAAAYTVASDQNVGGTGRILYNQAADTSGSIGSVSSSSRNRAPEHRSLERLGPVLRIPVANSLRRPAYNDRDVIVRYRDGVDRDALERSFGVVRAYALARHTLSPNVRVVDVPSGVGIETFAQRLRARPEIESVERDALVYKQTSTAVTPNDTHFDTTEQWDMYDIGAPNAWGYTEGAPGVQIAMIDTGVDVTLPDFSGSKIAHAESVIDGNVTQGTSAVRDTDGHGTNTAGIAAAATNNGSGFAGTGFNVGLQIYKVFPDDTKANGYESSANTTDVTIAIDDAIANGAKVVNLSLGTCQAHGPDSAQEAVVARALASGVVIVSAAGNERSGESMDATCANGSSTIDDPAAYPGVISVGATSLTDTSANDLSGATEHVASYSNSGPDLTLVAPGGDPTAAEASSTGPPDYLHWISNLYSTTVADPSAQCPNKSDCKALFAGTSQASPHVAGVVALMLSENASLSPAQIKQILISTADDIGDPNQGNGRIDAYRALAVAAGDPHPPAPPSNINFVAIAYVPNGTNRPNIIDVTYPGGVPVASNGTFRVADVPATASSYKIGVWYDANGNGLVDAGDYFASSQTCTASAPCTSAAGLVATPVTSGFVLN